ncbi:MAG: glycosyltransferase family 2 protein [Candidatus Hydrogenedentes bacterium]|nr:glycosyltransferase family 2 protein [Candidatus Hydrogenedentota bacterium]
MAIHVSIIIPAYNEQAFIRRCLDSLIGNDFRKDALEILVFDGKSTDGTFGIVEEYTQKYPFIKLFTNPDRVSVKALNQGIRQAQGEILMRCDTHCEYPPIYVRELVGPLERGEADNVGGTIETLPSNDTPSGVAIAAALNHPFGVGLSFRTRKFGRTPVEVDTVPFGSWKKTTFEKVGLYDEQFVRAQDFDHNIRLRKAGGKILLLPHVVTKYFARNTLKKLARMAYQYGYAKTQIIKKHRLLGNKRQIFPALFVLGLPLTLLVPGLAWGYALYLCVALLVGLWIGVKNRSIPVAVIVPAAFFVMHTWYGVGYLKGLVDNFLLGRATVTWEATR